MSNANLHPLPAWGAVAREQFATAVRATRGAMIGSVFVMALMTYLFTDTLSQISRPTLSSFVLGLPVILLCLILPQGLWRQEEPAQRAYFYSMPVERFGHQLVKNGVGWVWAMLLSGLFYLLALVGAILTNARIADLAWWQWAAPLVGGTVAYLVAAGVSTAVNRPGLWILGGYGALVFLGQTEPMKAVTQGRYGFLTLATGARPGTSPTAWMLDNDGTMPGTTLSIWLGACALWMGAALVGMVVASRVHRDL